MTNKVRRPKPSFLLQAARNLRARIAVKRQLRWQGRHQFAFSHNHAHSSEHRPQQNLAQAALPAAQQNYPAASTTSTATSTALLDSADEVREISQPSDLHAADQPNPHQAKKPKPTKPKRPLWRRILRGIVLLFCLALLCVIVGLCWVAWQEMQNSRYQAKYFHGHAKQAKYQVGTGESPAIHFPESSPFDDRLGYADLPEFVRKLKQKNFEVTKQARISPKMAEIADLGLYLPYKEKTQLGLEMADCHLQPLFSNRYPERVFPSFGDTPPLLIKTLLFIENRELLNTEFPKRNPAVEWERLAKAVLEQAAHGFSGEHKTAGGSTLATQIEKYRHSSEGRTANVKDKLRQMVSASLRAYRASEDTTLARRDIVLDYLNTVPLSAKQGFGEVNGIGDGLWVWYGRDFQESREQFAKLEQNIVDPASASIYKEALSLMIAQRRPSYYLVDPDSDLETLTDSHLRVLGSSGVISPALRDAALQVKLRSALKTRPPLAPPPSFVGRKAVTAMRTHLAGLLGENRLYNIDRLDLSVVSTINAEAQQNISNVLRGLRDVEKAKEAGLTGRGMLGNGDPAKVVYSFTLLERGENSNYLRLQTDNYDQPLDINDGAKLDLGSTAKLRTLVTYLDIIDQLYQKLHALDAEALKNFAVDPKDKITQWALAYMQGTEQRDLSAMLDAAMERQYSASTAEGFFTGGGMHYFGNFRAADNGRVMNLKEALRNSVNLVFVRLMRDVAHYYMFQAPGSSATLLKDADDPRRAAYLSRFADREGREFIARFYPKYKNQKPAEAEKILLQNWRATPSRLAALYQTIAPGSSFEQFAAFVKEHLPSQNEISNEKLTRLFEQYSPANMSLADRGYVARVHPLELWVVGYLRKHQGASYSDVIAASSEERQLVYSWLFNTHRKHAQDKRIAGLLEVEGFLEIHRQWKKMGYPFDSMVPSYASALGASADRPSALAEMMGIIINEGVRKPLDRITSLHFAAGSPYETVLQRSAKGGAERVLSKEVAQVAAAAIREVVNNGTARRVATAFTTSDGKVLQVAGKTGTGDQRFDVYGAGGRLIESRFVNRSATFVFNIDERFYGSITAYVHGPQAENYDFTSALPVQLLKTVAPSLMPLLEAGKPVAGLPGMCAT